MPPKTKFPHMDPQEIGDLRPIPDPTVLTTQQLNQTITYLREIIETRLHGMDKAIELVQKASEMLPSFILGQVAQLRELQNEKFKSIATQFVERDTRTDQTSKDSKVAVDAALQAAKEAVGEQNKSNSLAIAKSEAATTKQLDQIGQTITLMTKGFDDKIEDIKERINGVDSRTNVNKASSTSRFDGRNDVWGFIIGAVGIIAAIATIIFHSIR